MRLRPVYAFAIVLLLAAGLLVADYALDGGFRHSGWARVAPDDTGRVVLDIGDFAPLEVRFYRFLNSGNQEVKFLVGKDENGAIQVGFDASESDYKRRRGFRHEGEWLVNNKCDTAVRLHEVNDDKGGCRPVALRHELRGDQLVLTESDILRGWRYFR